MWQKFFDAIVNLLRAQAQDKGLEMQEALVGLYEAQSEGIDEETAREKCKNRLFAEQLVKKFVEAGFKAELYEQKEWQGTLYGITFHAPFPETVFEQEDEDESVTISREQFGLLVTLADKFATALGQEQSLAGPTKDDWEVIRTSQALLD